MRLFDRFHWKLTFYYTVVSMLVVSVLVVLVLAVGISFYSHFYYGNIPNVLAKHAEKLAPYLANRDMEVKAQEWLESHKNFVIRYMFNNEPLEFNLRLNAMNRVYIVNKQQHLVASSVRDLKQLKLNSQEQALLKSALSGNTAKIHLTRTFPLRAFVALPVQSHGEVVGSLLFSEDFSDINDALLLILVILGIISLITALCGTLFGFVVSRGLTRRIRQVEYATSAWRQGNFSVRVQDDAKDELGHLIQRLNHMAVDVANHVHIRQELAMLSERNRLALELHDNIKQQVFAIGMKLGFAASLTNNTQLQDTLNDIGELTHQTQEALQRLIHELKPAVLEQANLTIVLENHITAWASLHNVKVQSDIQLPERLYPTLEQNILRVVQESFNNIAKHAQAQQAKLTLYLAEDSIFLSIHDDGCGFDVEQPSQGLGRRSMLERIQQHGGNLQIRSNLGKGTQVEAQIPIPQEKAQAASENNIATPKNNKGGST